MTEPFLFARRTGWPLASNKLSTDLELLRKEKAPILDLTESNPTRCGFSYPKNDIVKPLAEEKNLCYAPASRGSLEAREAVSRYYKEKGSIISPEHIFLTASTSEAYSYLFRLLADSGEHVLFPRPSYPLFAFLGDLNDVRMDTYPLVYTRAKYKENFRFLCRLESFLAVRKVVTFQDCKISESTENRPASYRRRQFSCNGTWNIDLEQLRRAFCGDTRALVLVSPNNPTGSFVRRREMEEINALCREHKTAIICDEVFADFAFERNEDHKSLVENDGVLTFVLGGVSKALGLPQMKLSWIVINGPRDLAEAAGARLEVIADTYLSVNTPAQNALPAWLSHRRAIQKEVNTRIKRNFDCLKRQAEKVPGCELLGAEGGWYAVLKIPDTHSEEEWALQFLHKDRVFVHPGYFFDFDTGTFAVVSLLSPCAIFQEGIKRILERIKNNGF